MPWAEAKGLLPGRGMPGRPIPWVDAKGLFPGRGIPTEEDFGDSAGTGSPGAVSAAGGTKPGVSSAGVAGFGEGAAGFLAAAGFSLGRGTTPSSAKAALSFRTTGGSTVDDGPLTNSPISFNFSSVRFESMPNSAAISCTRAFPATILLSGHDPSQGVLYLQTRLISSHS
jgi:hypothetical protein